MGFDLVTWAPAIGGSGDDLYNVPGAVTLGGSQDTGNPTLIEAGDASGFSSPPTIAEINASSGLNQVIGLLNRRIALYNAAYGTSYMSALSYLTQTKISATALAAINTKIGVLRAAEGFSVYTFPTDIASAKIIKGVHLANMRKALKISGVQIINYNHAYWYTEGWTTYPTTPAWEQVNSGQTPYEGKLLRSAYYCLRSMLYFPIPSWASVGGTPQFSSQVVRIYCKRDSTDEPFTFGLYSSNGNTLPPVITPAYAGSFYETDNLEASMEDTALPQTVQTNIDFAIDATRVANKSGNNIILILATLQEVARTGYPNKDGYADAYIPNYTNYVPTNGLVLDWGA
jgi:hypothetical protein